MTANNNLRKVFIGTKLSVPDVYNLWGYRGQTPEEAKRRLSWSFVRTEIGRTKYYGHYVEGVNNREFNVIRGYFEGTLRMRPSRINVELQCRKGPVHRRRNVVSWVRTDFPRLQPQPGAPQQTAMPQNHAPNMNTAVPQTSGTVPQQVPMPQNPHSNMDTPNPMPLRTRPNQTPALQNTQLNEMSVSGGSSPPNYQPLQPLYPELGNLDSDPSSNGPDFGSST